MKENDTLKKNLPVARTEISDSVSRASALMRLTDKVLAKPQPPDPKLLLDAAERGDAAEIKRLLAAGADVNAADKDGGTALDAAAYYGHADCVKILLAAGADVHAVNIDGWTALMAAANRGKTEVVKLLLAAGADVNAAANAGQTVLMVAVINGHVEVVKVLLAAGANPKAVDKSGNTASHVATTGFFSARPRFRYSSAALNEIQKLLSAGTE